MIFLLRKYLYCKTLEYFHIIKRLLKYSFAEGSFACSFLAGWWPLHWERT